VTAVEILYFARIREDIGHGSEHLDLPGSVTDVAGLMDYLQQRGTNYQAAFHNRDIIRIAVNQVHVTPDHPLQGGDEIAFFPPMTGG